jgi:small subunit ribosomal protein S2
MAVISMRQMLEAGVHFGHQTRRWNPKMKRFIFGERNGIYIIDLEQTLTRVETAYAFVRDLVANGGVVLFVGTKKQAQDPVQSFAEKVGMPYVNERWLGGMLTNFETMSKRVGKMLEYERMKVTGEFDAMIKKEALLLDRELTKLQRNLGGLRDMKKPPDCVFVIDTNKEHIAVTEANKLGIPVVAVVDTNVNPDVIQFPIPGNDDAIRANGLLVQVIAEAVEEGRYIASRRPKVAAAAGETAEPKPERSAEEEEAFAQAQAEARNAAARAQAEREARLSASKSKPATDADESPVAEAPTEEAPPAEAPVAEAPTEEAPPAEAPVAEAPTEEAPPAEAPYGEGSHAVLESGEQPEGYSIKGNADSMRYHTEESPFYARTKAEVWFATAQAAEAAGFSKPASQQSSDDDTES